jgi:WD40 repeat protein
VWDLDTGHMLRTLEGHSFFVNGVAVTPDGRVSFLRRRTPRSGCGIPRRAGRFAL